MPEHGTGMVQVEEDGEGKSMGAALDEELIVEGKKINTKGTNEEVGWHLVE